MARPPNVEAREKILRSALELFHRRGFNGVSMDEVASAAGLKKANLFHYYPTKEALGLAAVCHSVNGHREAWCANLSSKRDPLEAIEAIFDQSAQMMQRNACARGCVIGNLAQELSDSNEALREKIAECLTFWTDELAAFFDERRKDGYFRRSTDTRRAAEAVVALFEGAMLLSKASRAVRPFASAKAMALAYLGSLKSPKGGK